jgi:hypothetical protein
LLNLRSGRRGFRIICVSEHLGVEKQEDLTLQAADFGRAVLIEDWHIRLSKFDGTVVNRNGRLERRFFLPGHLRPRIASRVRDSEAPRESS